MKQLFDVSGKVALVTGGRRGIGRAFALALRDAGAKVAVVARSADSADLPDDIHYFPCDLADREQRSHVISRVVDHFGKIDILVNNAGVIFHKNINEQTPEIWDAQININLTAVFELSRDAARVMQGGKIIQLGSISSFTGARNISAYSAVKHGIIGLIKCLSNELMPLGINVNGIAPGFIDTDMHAHLKADTNHLNTIVGRIPAGRLGTPDDLIGALLFLASDASNYVSGTTILVDGGWCGR
jgi:2-deoxy-D-gluconate 3-dehydrogenase